MNHTKWRQIFGNLRPAIIGMIHVKSLPGSSQRSNSMTEIIEHACMEGEIYKKAKVDAILIENMHDRPYVTPPDVGPEVVAAMASICTEVRKVIGSLPCGVQILAAANQEALAVAHATGCQFIRAEGFVFSHIADEGLLNACAGTLLRYRRSIGADNVLILTDIKKKHSSHAITQDLDINDAAKAAEFFLSDGIIVTGKTTGDPPSKNEIFDIQKEIQIPVLVGSGITFQNAHNYLSCEGMIVGSHFKHDGRWEKKLNSDTVTRFMDQIIHWRTKDNERAE